LRLHNGNMFLQHVKVIIDAIYTINLILKISATSLQWLHLEDKVAARINDELQVVLSWNNTIQ